MQKINKKEAKKKNVVKKKNKQKLAVICKN